MKGPRFKSAMRSILDYIGEGMLAMGVPFVMTDAIAAELSARARRRAESKTRPDNESEQPDQLSITSLSRAERAEWAALVERLR
jgi:hypothetical protein